jgi:hypothetical protein
VAAIRAKTGRSLRVQIDPPNILLRRTYLIIQPDLVESVATLLSTSMNVHGDRRILTFNIEDFARYDIEAIHPVSLLS